MRRTFFEFIALLLAVATIAGQGWSPVRAQEATPAAAPFTMIELAPGLTAEVLAAVPSARAGADRLPGPLRLPARR